MKPSFWFQMAPLLATSLFVGCNSGQHASAPTPDAAVPATTAATIAAPTSVPAVTQTELVKPAAGKGNVQGVVLFNEKPVANIRVQLSQKFSTILGPSGAKFEARTDKNGVYVVKNVPPGEYEGLTAQVFDTPMVVYMGAGILKAQKYSVESDKTLFVDPTHLFKSDLKLLAPKPGAAAAQNPPELQWAAYPGAAYYKVSLYPVEGFKSTGVFGERIEDTTFKPEKPLDKGMFRPEITAYTAQDHKLAELPDGIKFTVK